ncbi:methionine aminopeptidase 1D, mitochondrial-like [Planococcus citri]|uniref:methionine aminopeptidase 1D, mitochondrial-like n=1 Tax=Planococcus citri TaxID=170843 RepID=UPI0031F9FDE2
MFTRLLLFSVIFLALIYFCTSWQPTFRRSDFIKELRGPYYIVKPLNVSGAQYVPTHIQRPPYVFMDGVEDAPDAILIKNATEIDAIAASCSIAREVMTALKKFIRARKTTDQVDAYAHELIIEKGAYPSPLMYNKYPKSICTSVNNIIVHGIPDNRMLHNGDIIKVDVSVYYKGFHGDCSETFHIGTVNEKGRRLVKVARHLLKVAIAMCKPGVRFKDLGERIEQEAKLKKVSLIPTVCGHGIGKFLHERPAIDHYANDDNIDHWRQMEPGMVFTIEPAIAEGRFEEKMFPDGWTLATKDNSRVAQFEHTIAITENGNRILTL